MPGELTIIPCVLEPTGGGRYPTTLTGFAERRTALMPPVPAPESSDATAAFCAAVLRGRVMERLVPIDDVDAGLATAGFFVDVAPSDEPAMLDSVLVVGFFVDVVVAGFFVEAMALRCATVTVPPVGVLVVFGFEAVPVVGR